MQNRRNNIKQQARIKQALTPNPKEFETLNKIINK